MADAERIYQLLVQQPGLKARQVASKLGLERSSVNSIIYRYLKGKLVQDKSYRWWPKGMQRQPNSQPEDIPIVNTSLSRLCRYYLDCLAQNTEKGISVFATSNYNNLDYAEIDTFPFVEEE